jgi:hypothetical protein
VLQRVRCPKIKFGKLLRILAPAMEQVRTQLEQELFKLSDEGWSYVLAEVGEQPTAADIKRFVLEVCAPSHSILADY